MEWSKEETTYIIQRFINNHFEKLIKFGYRLNKNQIIEEANLFKQQFKNKRTKGSINMIIDNIEFLALQLIKDNGNPYFIKSFKGLKNYSEKTNKIWEEQNKKYFENIDKWFKISEYTKL